uniref:Uncharacterized protein n=1 Tax=Rhizophora mucronata TaxID=61149 RepID=A0A2P2JDL3_RHIMU
MENNRMKNLIQNSPKWAIIQPLYQATPRKHKKDAIHNPNLD